MRDTCDTFGGVVQAARARAGMTLRELTAAVGLSSPSFLHAIEHNRSRMPPSRWLALCAALPSLDLPRLALAETRTRPTTLPPADLTKTQRARSARALVRAARRAA